ncbi:MAG TPA: DUF1285 domain-containing protein [Gammaproteobacteria bacterium]|mgnify:FL=1|jgi:hypothetical protein|nr:MAG: DUF1285 domain-containing protein [Proteobacteria bacterium TMED51]HAU41452.1 DUF1285 domain-containing protein [Gammaproteobacteria bacterium]HBP84597.1 DUF1285 domain-containing protein [Gammaproteobacteria bacterium]HCL93131.1 DUF1285 domain-containing protein [Gammaproteobacteria bacterium]|tara:strand:- start:1067 stop:1657 length:591 start_codon:yes stop_codon:yes gene_type:complete
MVLTEVHPETAGPLEKLARAVADEKLPPVDAWQPTVQKDMGLRISRDGAWHYLGSPIARPSLVRLLSRVMKREGEDFFLVSPVEKLRIAVEDAPFLAVELECSGESQSQRLIFRTNVDDVVIAGKAHPIWVNEDPLSGEPAPYIEVRDGLWALINRSVYYELAERVIPSPNSPGQLGVFSEGCFFELGSVDASDCA